MCGDPGPAPLLVIVVSPGDPTDASVNGNRSGGKNGEVGKVPSSPSYSYSFTFGVNS